MVTLILKTQKFPLETGGVLDQLEYLFKSERFETTREYERPGEVLIAKKELPSAYAQYPVSTEGFASEALASASASSNTPLHMSHLKLYSSRYNYQDPVHYRYSVRTSLNGNGNWHLKLEVRVQTLEAVRDGLHKFAEILYMLMEEQAIWQFASQAIALVRDFQNGANAGGLTGAIKKAEQIKNLCRGKLIEDQE